MFPCCFPFLCFWRNVYWSALVPCNLLCPEIFLVARLHSGIILFAKCSISYVWQCFEYVCLDNCPVICTLTLCYVLHQTHSESWHIPNSIYSGTCKHIQAYSSLLRHISHPVQTSHIHNLAIFWALAYLEPEAYSKPCEILTRHIQNLTIVRRVHLGIIQPYSEPCVTFVYAETCHIWNAGIFRTLPQLHHDAYSEPCHIYENR